MLPLQTYGYKDKCYLCAHQGRRLYDFCPYNIGFKFFLQYSKFVTKSTQEGTENKTPVLFFILPV